MFGDYMNPDLEPEDRVYEEVKSIDDFYKVAEQCLEEYNNTHKTRMNLVIFRCVYMCVCVCARVWVLMFIYVCMHVHMYVLHACFTGLPVSLSKRYNYCLYYIQCQVSN